MKILAVDFGDVRTGLAVCDSAETLASPAGVITERNMDKTAQKALDSAILHSCKLIVVGLPKNMDGTEGFRADICKEFAEKLSSLTDIPVTMWDERGTTVTAHNYLNTTNTRGKKRKAVVDTVAATVILENYLNYRKNNANANAL